MTKDQEALILLSDEMNLLQVYDNDEVVQLYTFGLLDKISEEIQKLEDYITSKYGKKMSDDIMQNAFLNDDAKCSDFARAIYVDGDREYLKNINLIKIEDGWRIKK